jgi:hypothetical protein
MACKHHADQQAVPRVKPICGIRQIATGHTLALLVLEIGNMDLW